MLILNFGIIFLKKCNHIEFFFNFRFMVLFSESDTIYKILNFITQWSFYYIY